MTFILIKNVFDKHYVTDSNSPRQTYISLKKRKKKKKKKKKAW